MFSIKIQRFDIHVQQFEIRPERRITPEAGLILTTYCVRYPHTVPFLRNKMPYSLLKTPKTDVVKGGVAF